MATAEIRYQTMEPGRRLEGTQVVETLTLDYVITGATSHDEAMLASGLPQLGDLASFSGFSSIMRCESLSYPELAYDAGVFICRAQFASGVSQEDQNDAAIPPEFRTPKWAWSVELVEEPLIEDAQEADKGIVNSVGEPLFTTTLVPIPVLTISRYESSFDPQTILDYVGKVNAAEFWGAAAGKAWMAGINDREETVDGRRLRFVEYAIKFRTDNQGWKAKLLDQGTYYSDGVSFVRFTDDYGNPTTGNLDGTRSFEGERAAFAETKFLEYNRYAEADFSALNLGPY